MAFAIWILRAALRNCHLLRRQFVESAISMFEMIESPSVVSQYADCDHSTCRLSSSTRISGEPHLRIFMCIATGSALVNCHYDYSFLNLS